ncbi:MAG: hypothetical protein J3K34DRAFT_430246 [Monoraphidium minutum]|nr:MAG: hypothetical protein J3K34DRAFT_430246 [Monoraphidium minutum]
MVHSQAARIQTRVAAPGPGPVWRSGRAARGPARPPRASVHPAAPVPPSRLIATVWPNFNRFGRDDPELLGRIPLPPSAPFRGACRTPAARPQRAAAAGCSHIYAPQAAGAHPIGSPRAGCLREERALLCACAHADSARSLAPQPAASSAWSMPRPPGCRPRAPPPTACGRAPDAAAGGPCCPLRGAAAPPPCHGRGGPLAPPPRPPVCALCCYVPSQGRPRRRPPPVPSGTLRGPIPWDALRHP